MHVKTTTCKEDQYVQHKMPFFISDYRFLEELVRNVDLLQKEDRQSKSWVKKCRVKESEGAFPFPNVRDALRMLIALESIDPCRGLTDH